MRKNSLILALVAILFLLPLCVSAQPGTISFLMNPSGGACTGDGGPASSASFTNVMDICTDVAGNIYIADNNCYSVRKIDHTTGIINTIAGNGTSGYSGDGGPGVLASLNGDLQIATDTAGNLYINDVLNVRVRMVNAATGIITTVAGGGSTYTSGAAATSVALYAPSGISVSRAGDLYFFDAGVLTKVSASTGILDSVACSSCGGMGVHTAGGLLQVLKSDLIGNMYFNDQEFVYKFDTAHVLTTIAGATRDYHIPRYFSDAGPATTIQISPYGICVDDTGTVYISSFGVIQRVSPTTGIINTIAGRVKDDLGTTDVPSFYSFYGMTFPSDTFALPSSPLCRDHAGNIYVAGNNGYRVMLKINRPYRNVDTVKATDSFMTPRNMIPAKIAYGVHGTLTETPGPTDSAHITVDFGDGKTISRTVPYWRTISGHDTVYGFGANSAWMGNHTYDYPGYYNISYIVTTMNNYTVVVGDTPIHVSSSPGSRLYTFDDTSACSSGSTFGRGAFFQDSVVSTSCTLPGQVLIKIRGWVVGPLSSTDSMYYRIHLNGTGANTDSCVIRKGTISPIPIMGGTYYHDTEYAFSYQEVLTYDTSLAYGHYRGIYYYVNSLDVSMNNGLGLTAATASVYYVNGPYDFCAVYNNNGSFQFNDCTAPGSVMNSIGLNTSGSSASCSLPFNASLTTHCTLFGSQVTSTSDSFRVDFGDGADTTYRSYNKQTDGLGSYFYVDTISHTYTLPGNYQPRIMAVGVTTDTSILYPIMVNSGCTPLTGVFYMDGHGTCTVDSSDQRLAYWPFVVINNTSHDTTYDWADASGAYTVNLIDSQSYTIIPNSYGFYGYTGGDSIHLTCPSTAWYSITAYAGGTYTQDFGFTCTPAGAMDMSVSGWVWGVVPGDTGVLSIWASNDWGFVCDTLNSRVTLNLDSRLTYMGMWSGPTPTSVSGRTISWDFSTMSGLLDFAGQVKVWCDTTATVFDTVTNVLHVSPTSLTDPDTLNNTYSWRMPVRSSWDPNFKQVSPAGYGAQGYIPASTPQLSYLIHFQNLGSDSARNITVADTIDANLNIASLQVIGSSAPVVVYHISGNIVKFRFNDIYLHDSADDPANSTGYVSFAIMPRDGLAPGTQIKNRAGIYFDYNAPVITNQTVNTIMDTTGISGRTDLCIGDTVHLYSPIAGGVWSAANSNATVASGVVTGVHGGRDTISYLVYGSELFTYVVTVHSSSVGTLSGATSVCVGATTTLTATEAGGTWSSAASTATVAAGVVTGVSSGTDTIYYSISSACASGSTFHVMSITPATDPGTLSGATSVCPGATTTVTATVFGGTWRSSGARATVSGGVVTGVAAGTDTIYYIVSGTCGAASAFHVITISPATDAGTLSGSTSVCPSATITITPSVTGGTWRSSGASASVTGGVVTGVTAGTDTIYYSISGTCGTASTYQVVTINPATDPGTLSGTATVCPGTTTTITPTVAGGTWRSAGATATVAAGLVTGVSAGTDSVYYSISGVCGTASTAILITIDPNPVAGTITGQDSVCLGDTARLGTTGMAGSWSSSNGSIASVSASGIVSGVSAGGATITYTVSNSCGRDSSVHAIYVKPHSECNVGVVTVANNAGSVPAIYPNPTSGLIEITWDNPVASVLKVTIATVTGQVVSEVNDNSLKGNALQLDLSGYASGMYIYTIHYVGGVTTGKIVLQK